MRTPDVLGCHIVHHHLVVVLGTFGVQAMRTRLSLPLRFALSLVSLANLWDNNTLIVVAGVSIGHLLTAYLTFTNFFVWVLHFLSFILLLLKT